MLDCNKLNLQREPYPHIWWPVSGIYESMPSSKMVKILKNKYSLFLAIEEINKNQSEWFKDSQEEIDPVLKTWMLKCYND